MTLRRFWGTALGLVVVLLSLMPLGPATPTPRAWVAPAAVPPAIPMADGRPTLLQPAHAGPVDWREVEASPDGRQWWDAGSLRRDRRGQLSVLSRFQPAAQPAAEVEGSDRQAGDAAPAAVEPALGATAAAGGASPATPGSSPARRVESRPQPGTLYVMELDCDQELYRDISVNGIPRWGAPWQTAAGDSLTMATLRAACAAAPPPHG